MFTQFIRCLQRNCSQNFYVFPVIRILKLGFGPKIQKTWNLFFQKSINISLSPTAKMTRISDGVLNSGIPDAGYTAAVYIRAKHSKQPRWFLWRSSVGHSGEWENILRSLYRTRTKKLRLLFHKWMHSLAFIFSHKRWCRSAPWIDREEWHSQTSNSSQRAKIPSHLTFGPSDLWVIWPLGHLTFGSFDLWAVWPSGHLTRYEKQNK